MKPNTYNTNAGKIIAISTSKRKGIAKSNVASAKLVENWGIEGDAHAGNWHRQISFLAIESIDKMKKTLPELKPGMFAENITTEFIDIPNLKIGTRIKIGKNAELEITQIGKECHDKCSIYFKVGTCVMPTEGIFGKVIKEGDIFVNDNVQVIN